MQEQAEGAIDLPNDEPAIVKYMLQYMYTSEYELDPGADSEDSDHFQVYLDWSQDGLTREVRRRLQDGIFYLNHEGMAKLVALVNRKYPDKRVRIHLRHFVISHADDWGQPNQVKRLWLHSSEIGPEFADELLAIIEDPKSKEGDMFHDDPPDDGLLAHAKVYIIADKYDIHGLREFALHKLQKDIVDVPFDAEVKIKTIHHLMDNTTDRDEAIRTLIAEELCGDMDWFGMRTRVQGILDRYPQLRDFCLRYQFQG